MINITTYAQLNIGRNINDVPTSSHDWTNFQALAAHALCMAALDPSGSITSDMVAEITETHTGRGGWGGVPEDSAHISLYWEEGIDIGELNRRVKHLCAAYRQDAIAVVTGASLVTPKG